MRIGIFTDTYVPNVNGVVTSILMLKQGLEELGHHVFIVTSNAEELGYKVEDKGKLIRLPSVKTGFYDYRLSNIYSAKAMKQIKEWDLDVIHSQQEFTIGVFARIVANQLALPVVHTYHTMYEDYTHYITKGYFDNLSKKIVAEATKFYCDKTVSELIVPSAKAYRLFKEKYKFEKNVHIIPNGIDVSRFYKEKQNKKDIEELRNKLNLKEEDFVILNVSRVAKEKNFDFLIEVQKEIIKKNKNAKLLIVGPGPDIERLKKKATKLKIEKNVIFTDKVPYDEVPKYYQLADAFATASKSETQGVTVIEAMGSSLPVVAINDESFTDVIVHELNGFIYKNKKEYLNIILKLMADANLRKKIGHQARINSEMFIPKHMAEKALKVYKLAVESNPKQKKKDNFIAKLKRTIRKGFYGK